eukprot:62476_1
MELQDYIKTINILNVEQQQSTTDAMGIVSQNKPNDESFIVSDADEELLILIEFKEIIELHSLQIYALIPSNVGDQNELSQPKQVHIYRLASLNVNFDDMKSLKPDKSKKCSAKKLAKGQVVDFKKQSKTAIKFKSVKCIAIYIESNQKDTEQTVLNAIKFKATMDASIPSNNTRTDQNDPRVTGIFCGDINSCHSWKQFLRLVKNNSSESHAKEPNSVQSENIINHYIHLIYKHDTDKALEVIVNALGKCDISTCKAVARNHRNRSESNNRDLQDVNLREDAIRDIFDKMHCYFVHCFEIGNRFTAQEKEVIATIGDEKVDDSNASLVNANVLKMKEILRAKLKNVDVDLRQRMHGNHKYNQLDKIHESGDGMFCAGFRFGYYDTESKMQARDYDAFPHEIAIHPTYSCLKHELTQNRMCRITIQQFNLEHEKAKLHFNCKHRKDKYPEMHLDWLLAVMIYCNYTELQYVFSKTYRENKGKDHTFFYWLGKLVQSALQKVGDDAYNQPSLYHGIGDKLVVPLSDQRVVYGIQIYCPLSTTSSFEVALNFADHNQGLVIEFNNRESSHVNDWEKHCLSCSWMSDFGNEKEYLFVQSDYMFTVANITHAETGTNYNVITKALTMIEQTMTRPAHVNTLSQEWSKGMQALMVEIVQYELNGKCTVLNDYAKKLCTAHFDRVESIELPWNIRNGFEKDLAIFESFYHSNRAINLMNIVSMYSKLQTIQAGYDDVDLARKMMDKLLQDWVQIGTQTLTRINIALEHITAVSSLIDFADTYSVPYGKIGLNVTGFVCVNIRDMNGDVIGRECEISKRDKCEVMRHLLSRMDNGVLYFRDDENVFDVQSISTMFPILKNNGLSLWIKIIDRNRVFMFVAGNEETANRWYGTIKKSLSQDVDDDDQHGCLQSVFVCSEC